MIITYFVMGWWGFSAGESGLAPTREGGGLLCPAMAGRAMTMEVSLDVEVEN